MRTTGTVYDTHVDTARPSASGALALDLGSVIAAAQIGDEAAFARLMESYRHVAQKAAFHILHTEEATADAVQEAWIKVHRAIPRFKEGNFRAWLVRIVTNTCYDHLRRQKRRPWVSLEKLVDRSGIQPQDVSGLANPEEHLLRKESWSVLCASINDLTPRHREVVVLVDVQGHDYKEAATLLSIPVGTVKSRLSRARAALRDSLVDSDLLAAG